MPQRGVRKIEQDSAAGEALRAVVAAHDRESVASAYRCAIQLYLDLREDERPERIIPAMPGTLEPFLVVNLPVKVTSTLAPRATIGHLHADGYVVADLLDFR